MIEPIPQVRLADPAKKRRQRKPDPNRYVRDRRARLRKQAKANPDMPWYDHCEECDLPIKRSQKRMFCEGGECRKAFEAKLQESRVRRVIPIKHKASSRGETFAFIPGLQPSGVPTRSSHGYPMRWHKIEETSTTLGVLFPYDEPLFARVDAVANEPLGDFLARIKPTSERKLDGVYKPEWEPGGGDLWCSKRSRGELDKEFEARWRLKEKSTGGGAA
jgi:hypothetical protein